MAYIESCSVQGLAGQVNRTIRLNRDVNVFFGGNGSGKTSLLKVLHSALSNDLSEMRRIALHSAKVVITDGYLDNDHWYSPMRITRETPEGYPVPTLKLNSASIFGSLNDRTREMKQWNSTSDREAKDISFRHTFMPITRLYYSEEVRPETAWGLIQSKSEADLDKSFKDTINFLWLRYTRNIGIDVQTAQADGLRAILYDFLVPESHSALSDQSPIANPQKAYEKLLAFLDRQSNFSRASLDEDSFTERMKSDPRLRLVIKDVDDVEERVEEILRPRTELAKILRQMIGSGKDIELHDRDIKASGNNQEEISLEDLSSGEKQLLRIFIDALLANGQPIIIDEPELSLHIDWQRRLLGILRRLAPASQIIVATHSPEILAELSDDKIIQL
jgi:predicted ATPase